MSVGVSLAGKRALVFGGAGGIGAATCRMLAEEGAEIVMTHRPGAERAAVAQQRLAALPGSGHVALPADVGDTPTLVELRKQLQTRGGRLDILVNCAAFTQPVPHADLEALGDDLIDAVFRVNWRGQFAAIRVFLPMLLASGNGLVVNVSSITGITGLGSSIAYAASKAGIDVMTKSLARALAPTVRVMGVSPGLVDTSFVPGRGADFNDEAVPTIPLKRIATVDDCARAIVACATHLTYSTGVTVIVDGGRSLPR